MADFALLDHHAATTAYLGQWTGHTFAEFWSYSCGEARPAVPVRIEHFMGRKNPSDSIWIDSVRQLIVSARAVARLDLSLIHI